MHIDTVPNRGSTPTILLRESFREGKKVHKRTLANLSALPPAAIVALRGILKGEAWGPVSELLAIDQSRAHGAVKAVLGLVRKLGIDTLIHTRASRQRDLVVAMIVDRVLHGSSKLACTRLWHTTTLAEELNVQDAEVEDLYAAMDWLLAAQPRIEKKLAERHLGENAQVLYDVSSSYYEGEVSSLVQYGYNRDGKKGRPIIVYGLLTSADGCPVALEVYPGSTGDPTTVPDQVGKLQQRFGLSRVVLVGDRGMLTDTQIDRLRTHPQLGWISALRHTAIRELVESKTFDRSLFDHANLAEIRSPDYPGERLVACFNPLLADRRAHKRRELLSATQAHLERLRAAVQRRTRSPMTQEQIALKAGRLASRYKMAKHFELTIEDGVFEFVLNDASIARESSLDGIYIVRTSEQAAALSADDVVRSYKNLARVEQGFRCMKGLDVHLRPIRHRLDDKIRAHAFLCMLAYYVVWHLRQQLAPLLFEDEALPRARQTRDPVAPAKPSASVSRKKSMRQTSDGQPAHSLSTLLAELATLTRNRCRIRSQAGDSTFSQESRPTPIQTRAFQLLGL